MYPDATIECSDYITNLIEAFSRGNIMDQETQEKLAITRMNEKKPRPCELIEGNAVVRPGAFEYKPGYHESKMKRNLLSSSPDESEPVEV